MKQNLRNKPNRSQIIIFEHLSMTLLFIGTKTCTFRMRDQKKKKPKRSVAMPRCREELSPSVSCPANRPPSTPPPHPIAVFPSAFCFFFLLLLLAAHVRLSKVAASSHNQAFYIYPNMGRRQKKEERHAGVGRWGRSVVAVSRNA